MTDDFKLECIVNEMPKNFEDIKMRFKSIVAEAIDLIKNNHFIYSDYYEQCKIMKEKDLKN